MKIIFFGTPDFAVKPLLELSNSSHQILAVVTQEDKKGNRGKIVKSPVKELAEKLSLPIFQFKKIREEGFEILKELGADIFITCAYGQIISQEIIDIPKYGILNIHASLLPKWRGASPIQSSILSGDKKTGITIMKTELTVDTGDILMQEEIDIEDNDTSESIFSKLSEIGSKLIVKALEYADNDNNYKKQNHQEATYSKMIKKKDGIIDFEKSFEEIERHTRAMYSWPSSYTFLDNKMLKIFKIEKVRDIKNEKYPYIYIDKQDILIDTKTCTFKVLELQIEGSKRVSAKDYINGNRFNERKKLENDRI